MANIYLKRQLYDKLIRLQLEPKHVIKTLITKYLNGEIPHQITKQITTPNGDIPPEILNLINLETQHAHERKEGIL